MDNGASSTAPAEEIRCAECNTLITEGTDREVTDDAAFCRPCYTGLTAQLQQVVAEQGRDINYPTALAGALGGAVVGVLVWWGFTVVTSIAFGLVAIVIGITVGKGIVLFSGGKRHVNLQIMSVAISALAFFYASYLVNRTFIHRAGAEEASAVVLPLLPAPELFVQVVGLSFGLMDLVFLGIVAYEAWKIPAPFKLRA